MYVRNKQNAPTAYCYKKVERQGQLPTVIELNVFVSGLFYLLQGIPMLSLLIM